MEGTFKVYRALARAAYAIEFERRNGKINGTVVGAAQNIGFVKVNHRPRRSIEHWVARNFLAARFIIRLVQVELAVKPRQGFFGWSGWFGFLWRWFYFFGWRIFGSGIGQGFVFNNRFAILIELRFFLFGFFGFG